MNQASLCMERQDVESTYKEQNNETVNQQSNKCVVKILMRAHIFTLQFYLTKSLSRKPD